jgi:hypothetical protein
MCVRVRETLSQSIYFLPEGMFMVNQKMMWREIRLKFRIGKPFKGLGISVFLGCFLPNPISSD